MGADAPTPSDHSRLSRRRFLGSAAGAVGLAAAGLVGYEWPHAAPEEQSPYVDSAEVQRFRSRPDLAPPAVRVSAYGSPASGGDLDRKILLSPRHVGTEPSQQGLMILDRSGNLVYFQPFANSSPFDFNVQSVAGTDHLTYWEGELVSSYGKGVAKIADDHYTVTETVHAGDGLTVDLHEFLITARGTAYITAFALTDADLRSRGGSHNGRVLAGHAQEIDLATGRVLFDWNSLKHIGVDESYLPLPSGDIAYDYFHINSIAETPDGNLLISARNTWALYKVDRSTGAVIWRMNGRRSDFTMGAGAKFFWQHDARMPATGTITVFDDGSAPAEEAHARGLRLDVNEGERTVALRQAYIHPAGFVAANQGSMQLLADGRVFIGWGNEPYFSEFSSAGELVLDGQLPIGVRSYRAFEQLWSGAPDDRPALAVEANPGGGVIAYASFNGATEIATWQILAGTERDRLTPSGTQPWDGFETAIAIVDPGPYYAAVAIDAAGTVLGRSETIS
jgi:hypothetical protein